MWNTRSTMCLIQIMKMTEVTRHLEACLWKSEQDLIEYTSGAKSNDGHYETKLFYKFPSR